MGRKAKSEAQILTALWGRELSFAEIVSITKLPKATVSHALDRLEKRGLIIPRVIDGRIKWVLTPRGATLLTPPSIREKVGREMEPLFSKLKNKPLESWTDEEWQTLFQMIRLGQVGKDLSPEKFEEARKCLIQAWPDIKADLSLEVALGLMLSIAVLDKINEKEDFKRFFEVYLPGLWEMITRPITDNFLIILKAVMKEKLEKVSFSRVY